MRPRKPGVVSPFPGSPNTDGVHTDYLPPTAPTDIPDGSTAEKEEMIAAMQRFKRYNSATEAYLRFLEHEANAGRIMPLIHDRLHNDAVDTLRRNVNLFNLQVRRFRAREEAAAGARLERRH